MNIQTTSLQVGDKQLEIEIGRYAQQANMSVQARLGDTIVLANVVMSGARDDISWFPLQVEYQEKLYAGGKIKGSRWVKRDGRPTDDVILKSRLIDRTIRPLFPEGFKNDVQVVATVLSADGENDADMVAMFAVATALSLSDIPWNGPVGAVRMGYLPEEDKLLVNPTYTQREASTLDLVVSASKEAVVMVEAGANEVTEAVMLQAFKQGQQTVATALDQLQSFIDQHSRPKAEYTPQILDKELVEKVKKDAGSQIKAFVKAWAQLEAFPKDELIAELAEKYGEDVSKGDIAEAIDKLMKAEARRQTAKEGVRPDGRKTDEIRPINCEVDLLPRTHGSAMFMRGSTQALTITTLGAPSLSQLIESMDAEEEHKRYIHHYNMPPYSVGETGRIGYPGRREIGHGALAERALEPMIPSEDDFPYTIHVVSEIMSSNGSTSQASVCGSTMSLMAAGVPIKKPVSGIAMGLIKEDADYIVLSDIQGLEDFTGDMDFKVAGTADGITAMQMDIKISGIPMEVLERALEQARVGRLHILDKMLEAIAEPRAQLSPYAPKIVTITIPVERIGEIIGPSGKIIKAIIAETGAEIDVNDEGRVFISSQDDEAINRAKNWILDILREIVVGEEFDGTVTRVESYGAFVTLTPSKEGLVHVSKMAVGYVESADKIVSVGDTVHVRVDGVDDQGKISLTMLSADEEAAARVPQARDYGNNGRGRQGRDRGGNDRSYHSDRRGGRNRSSRRDSRR